jgi:hypothetical protein
METSLFFRVEHDLLRSEAFQKLGGSAIKVYLVIGLHSDFGTGWAYPSIRTIAKQAGLSRQTVLTAIEELCDLGMLATSKSAGRATAYRILGQAPARGSGRVSRPVREAGQGGPESGPLPASTVPNSWEARSSGGPRIGTARYQELDWGVPEAGRKQEPETRRAEPAQQGRATAIAGTPFQVTAEGRLLVSVDLQELLTSQGLSPKLAEKLLAQRDAEDVAKVLLNALYLQRQGKLQNGPGYIRTGIEERYGLLPQVATHLESRRRQLQEELARVERERARAREEAEREEEERRASAVLDRLTRSELDELVRQSLGMLPAALVRRNPTLSNPLVRSKVVELAESGCPSEEADPFSD